MQESFKTKDKTWHCVPVRRRKKSRESLTKLNKIQMFTYVANKSEPRACCKIIDESNI